MIKTILIPTDFSVASLNTLRHALEQAKNNRHHIVLLYAEILTDSISDLLFYSRERIISPHITPAFIEALEIIKNRFEKKVSDIEIIPFHGRTMSAMQTFLKANKVDEIFIPPMFSLSTAKQAFDPLPFLKKAGVPVHEIKWGNAMLFSEKDQLLALLNWAKN